MKAAPPSLAEIDAADRAQLRVWLNDPACALGAAEQTRLCARIAEFMRSDQTVRHHGRDFRNPDADPDLL